MIKKLYILLIIASILLMLFGGVCIEMIVTYVGQQEGASEVFSLASIVIEMFAIVVGLLGFKSNTKISVILITLSIPMLVWSFFMFLQPTHISVDEVLIFWILYCVALITLSALGFKNKPKEKIEEWDESILDDLI